MPQAHSSTVTRTKRPRREGSHGLPMALSPWLCLRRRPCDRTSPAQAASPCRFLPPCVLIPPLTAATAARERAAFRVSSRYGPSIPLPWGRCLGLPAFRRPCPVRRLRQTQGYRQAGMREAKVVIDVIQRELLPQPVLALA